ncbi:MAG: septum formation family protein [Silanimonas sp.]
MSLRLIAPLALILSLSACGGGASDATTDATTGTEPAETEDVGVFDLAIGDCLIDDTEGEVAETTKIDCAAPHLSEVYHLFDLPGGTMPEGEAMNAAVQAGCLAAFEPYVGLDYDSSEYVFTTLEPTPESWADGDREVVCMLATQDDSKITGSLRNAKR